MKIEVPEDFVEVLRKIEREVPPENVVNWLEWASQNPEGARRLVEVLSRLGRAGRHEFEVCLWFGMGPEDAVKSAIEDDLKHRRKRSLLS